jgi:hypothetical protein
MLTSLKGFSIIAPSENWGLFVYRRVNPGGVTYRALSGEVDNEEKI